MRQPRWSVAVPIVLATFLAACSSATAPMSCAITSADPLTSQPEFSGRVGRVGLDANIEPGQQPEQLDVWLTIPPSTDPGLGVAVSATTAVFSQKGSGALVAASRCAITVGTEVGVWIPPFSGPPPYTLDTVTQPSYAAVQIVLHR